MKSVEILARYEPLEIPTAFCAAKANKHFDVANYL